MSPHTALRLAVRPLGGCRAKTADQFASAATAAWSIKSARHSFSHSFSQLLLSRRAALLNPSICLLCSFQPQIRPQPGARLFSSLPPSKPPGDGSTADLDHLTFSSSSPPEGETSPPAVKDDSSPASAESDNTPADPPSTSTSASTSSTSDPDPGPELPSTSEHKRHPLYARFSTFMDNLQTRVLEASQTINDLTGYSAIEAIKLQNSQLEAAVATAQERLRAARHNYKALTSHRAATQREVTTLLARKDTWNPTDLERFTTLYRLDHELEAQVTAASAELTEAETEDSKLSADLNAGILKRYHEEQIWSDRIRRQSTWGTWGLMGINILLFFVLQFVAEPWRRKRLMNHIAAGEKEVMGEVKRELAEVRAALEASGLREMGEQRELAAQAAAAAAVEADAAKAASSLESDQALADETAAAAAEAAAVTVEEVDIPETVEVPSAPWQERWKVAITKAISDPDQLKAAVVDLSSDRRIDLRMRDVSLIALEGAVAGAALVGAVALILLRGSP
ncbi:Mdm33 family-domain-containing protein [Podospora appendiculata]|uniref:Sensitive to high expression protein 9, mitochondrial n=1 Tax=Podospora appendiculata TaxID=314037 RepID=A0AAE0X846_9PEZI|nr:Mdm33 family-domain-containing protein [Podospora appendiculata]